MKCPFCTDFDNKVVDSRLSGESDVIRRRRECLSCGRRFTTYERVEDILPMVIKKDDRREPFDRNKVLSGFTNMYDFDPDVSTKAIIRLNENAPLKKYHRFQHIYSFILYGLMTFSRLFGEMSTLLKHNQEGITTEHKSNPKLEVVKLAITKILYLGILIGLPLWLTEFSFWQIILGFIVMQLTAGMIMTTVFQMAHVVEGTYQPLPDENNVIHSDWLVHQMRATSDFGRNNGLLSWYIGGLDYQVEHHLFPNICHIHYPSIAPIIEATAEEFGFEYKLQPTILHALGSHFRRLKELGVATIQPIT